MKFRWSPAPPQPLLAGQLANALSISPLLAQCLLNRGLSETAQLGAFLEPRLRNLADPFLLPDMELAVDRLFKAREQNEPLVIFGDYDVDGVTSTALLIEVLRHFGWNASYYVPRRSEEGYGLSREGTENCLRKYPVSLVLAVDCGSTAVDSIAWLRERKVDVIVLDHHQVSSHRPAALALVNPFAAHSGNDASSPETGERSQTGHRRACFAELCSVGLAFKLAHALVKRGRETGLPGARDFDLRPLLDLVALGSIADIVPLQGENRILVSAGIERLNATQRPGLLALKQVAQCQEPLDTHEIGFQIAPRLNAAGRLETAEEALRLLLARDAAEAVPLARNLEASNRERQRIERVIVEEAVAAASARFQPDRDFVIVEGQVPWHVGVVGIVASRVLQHFYRPTIIVGGEGTEWRGSGRSIAGFDLAAALRECDDLLTRHGGHAMAAGLAIVPGNLDAFRIRLNQLAQKALRPEDLQATLRLDAEVGLDEMTLSGLASLAKLKPTGQGNPGVHFFSRNLEHQRPLQRMGADKQHVKMWVTDGASTQEAVWWRAGNESLPVGRFDLAFAPQINQYNGRQSVQLKVLDWRKTQ
jgi:single-stranded-DNA-specific exonuclease